MTACPAHHSPCRREAAVPVGGLGAALSPTTALS